MKIFQTTIQRTLAVALLAAALSAVSGCGSSNAAAIPPVATTAILVHGAWADGSSWAKVTPLLLQRGVKVVSVQLQRASLAADAEIVRRAIAAETGQVILVGHSYGGAVITEAGTDSKVLSLVYVDAFALDDNESVSELTSPFPTGAWQSGLVKDSAGYLTLNTPTFLNSFAADVPTAEATLMSTSQGPINAQALLFDKVTHAAWKTKPSFFAIGSNDLIIPPDFQTFEANRIHAKVTMIPGASHVSMVSHPIEVANVILAAVASVNGL